MHIDTDGPRSSDVGVASATIDVLVPHFSDPQGLHASLVSIAQQTWNGDIRVVILDDGSPQAEYEEVEQLASQQPFRVTLKRSEANLGRPRARNLLLAEVNATYLAWLDAGDVWYPQKLELQFLHFRKLELEGVDLDRVWMTCHYDWAENGNIRSLTQRTTRDQAADILMGDRLRAYLWTLLGRTTAFRAAGLFDENLPRLQDLDYFINFLVAGGALVAPPTRTPLCRYNKSDIGRDHRQVAACSNRVLNKHLPLYERYGSDFRRRVEWKQALVAARFARNNRSRVAVLVYQARAIARAPRYSAFRVRKRLIGR
jgi:glycosyltransferase involved in cell wall biosynthesis